MHVWMDVQDQIRIHRGRIFVSTFRLLRLLGLEALVQLARVIAERFRGLMEDLVLGGYRRVDALHRRIELMIRHAAFHVPERDTAISVREHKACEQSVDANA